MRVLLADHAILRKGVRMLLDSQPDLEVERRLKPDIVVMDVSMPELKGIEASAKSATH